MRRTVDVSGFGGSYEHTCQVMLDRGLTWLREHPNAKLVHEELPGMYGIIRPASPDMAALIDAITADNIDCTGAMVHCIANHLRYIHAHGYDKWLGGVEAARPDRVYTWDGTKESCPVTELSLEMERRKR